MNRNRLKWKLGDSINAIMNTAGMNFRTLICWFADFFAFILEVDIWDFSRKTALADYSDSQLSKITIFPALTIVEKVFANFHSMALPLNENY